MSAQWPVVIQRLVDLLPTLPGWDTCTVYDGPPPTANPKTYATVGYQPDSEHAGTYSSSQAPDGYQRVEVGSVIGQLVCETGSVDVPLMRGRAFVLMDAFDAYIRANRTLGGTLSPEGTVDLTVDPLPVANKNGTAFALNFSVEYLTVT